MVVIQVFTDPNEDINNKLHSQECNYNIVQSELKEIQNNITIHENMIKTLELEYLPDKQYVYDNVTLRGHSYWVRALLQLKDGNLASGSCDKTIKIWSMKSNDCIKTIETGHKDSILSLIQLKRGYIVSSAYDGTIEIRDDISYCLVLKLNEHSDHVSQVIELYNNYIASVSFDSTIKIWDLNKVHSIKTIYLDFNAFSLIQLKDRRLVCGGGTYFSIKLIEIQNNNILDIKKEINGLKGHKNTILSLLELQDGRLASGSADNSIKIWDIKKHYCHITLNGHENAVSSLIQISTKLIASGSWDKSIRIWNIYRNQCTQILKEHGRDIFSIIQLTDGKIVSASMDRTIKIFSNN
jgi:WD40 repeat protein